MSTASIGRATLGAEFQDLTSEQMLRQPEPQYLHARLLLAKLGMSLRMADNAGLNIAGRAFPTSGAPYADLAAQQLDLDEEPSDYLDLVTMEMAFLEAPGGKLVQGHTIRLNRPKFTDTAYTKASRRIPRGSSISTTPTLVQSEQTTLTIERFGGPLGDSGAVQPYALERFDAARSVHDLKEVRDLHFARDFWKTVDAFMVADLDGVASGNVIWPDGMTADNDATQAGQFPFSLDVLRKMKVKAATLNLPTFKNGRRMAFITPLQESQLQKDLEFRQLAQFLPPKNPLLTPGYYKTIEGIDIFVSNTLTVSNNSHSIPIHRAQLLAPGAIGCAPGEFPRVALNTNDNYGENPLAIWLWYVALSVLDDRFTVRGDTC